MSDLSIYELEDIIWDDFKQSGDHIVPHPTNNQSSEEDNRDDDICKKPRIVVTTVQNDEEHSKTLNEETAMMEKDSWSNTPDGVFTASGDADSAKDMPCVQSGDAKLPSHCFKSSNINYGSESYNDLNLFSNDGSGKESSDLLYYSWPNIGSFEDVDRLLINCDSSFGLGVTGNDDELVWFASQDPDGGLEETMKMDLNLSCSDPSVLTNNLRDHEPQESENKTSSFVSGSKDQREQLIQQILTDEYEGELTSTQYIQSSGYPHQGHHNVPMFKSETEGSNKLQSMESSSQPLFTGNQNQPEKKLCMMEQKFESSLDVPDGSSLSSELDEISLEATAFRQLQHVTLQLDLRTRLCIRDSLYRLAKSAEQRHDYAGINHTAGGQLVTNGTNKYTGLVDMETDTNPIDRTVAHLLFHRPSDSTSMPVSLPLKPNQKVHGSKTGPATVTKKPSCQQAENESDDKVSSTGKSRR